jgi:hypothetical protein
MTSIIEFVPVIKLLALLFLSLRAFFSNDEVINIKYSLYMIILILLWKN